MLYLCVSPGDSNSRPHLCSYPLRYLPSPREFISLWNPSLHSFEHTSLFVSSFSCLRAHCYSLNQKWYSEAHILNSSFQFGVLFWRLWNLRRSGLARESMSLELGLGSLHLPLVPGYGLRFLLCCEVGRQVHVSAPIDSVLPSPPYWTEIPRNCEPEQTLLLSVISLGYFCQSDTKVIHRQKEN